MDSLGEQILCPACGYSRVGLAADARCPECGAEGFTNAFTVEGTWVRPGVSPAAVGSFAGIAAAVTIVLLLIDSADPPLALLALCFCAVGVVWSVRKLRSDDDTPRAITATWLVHPRGVVITTHGTQRHIPIEAITAIDGADSLVGSVTQVSIRVRFVSTQTLSWRPILYLRGSHDERRSQLTRIRRTLAF